MQWPFHKVVHLSTPLINPPLIAHCVLDCNVTIRTAPLFLFAVWGEIQYFSDLKVISLTILNKLQCGGSRLLWQASYPSIHPFFLLNWVGYNSFTQKMKVACPQTQEHTAAFCCCFMRKKADGFISWCFVFFVFMLAVYVRVVYW